MQFRSGLMALATAAGLLAGCTKQPDAQFREYVDESPKPAPRKSPADKVGPRDIATKKTASADERDALAETLPAAIGLGSHVVLSDSFRIPPDVWLTPAVGPAAAFALVSRLGTKPQPKDGIAPTGLAKAKASATPREIKVLVKNREFRAEGPDGALRVSYDDIDLLRVINMDPVTLDAPKRMPTWLRELDGKRIRIRGFMSPAFKQTGLEGFHLGRDNKACCFPGKAKIYDLFPVRLKKGHTTDYIQNRPFDVVGTFQIKPWIDDGTLIRLYQIVDAVVVQ